MPRPSLDEYFVNWLAIAASRSTCARRAVAAIITDSKGRVLSTGYNGVAPGQPHCINVPCPGASDEPGNNRRCEAIHAEVNAITDLRGNFERASRLYCSCTPCFDCCKLILATAIKRVVVIEEYADRSGLDLLHRGGVKVYRFERGARNGSNELLWYPEDLVAL